MSQPSATSGPLNRLGQETSPYLRQHAANPVDWYPWCDEAIERSRLEKKPILLSIGYSACHWCHVMAHESFEDAEVAKLMNEYFVNIKVDREERPDLDQLYQGVVTLMGRGGGWPLTVFLTPELRPFFGGTYFPPEDKFGIPGFSKLLRALHEAWLNKQDDIQGQATQFESGLRHLSTYGLDAVAAELSIKDVVAAGQKLDRELDRAHGGFGSAPKFPNPMNVALLMRAYRRSGNGQMLTGIKLTLEKMALGGIYDQLGGGFHRYSVDDHWGVPHFEKMLYDNAQLLHLYSEAQQLLPNPLWAKIAAEIVEYVRREMTSPTGGFYATQDADSEGEEGKFFVWTPAEIDAALPPEQADVVKRRFNVTDAGNFEDGHTVLAVAQSIAEIAQAISRPEAEVLAWLDAGCRTLFEVRERRPKPGRDEKILVGWNGLMIRGLAFASRAFGRPEWLQLAQVAADFLLASQWKDSRLYRSNQDGNNKIDGFVEDYGDFASGLTALFQATGKAQYIEAADAIVRRAVELFWDPERQAYFSAPKGQKDLLCANYALQDNAFPSGASTLTEALVAVAALTGKLEPLEQAGKYLGKMHDEMLRNPFAFGHLLLAADTFLEGAAEVTVVGDAAGVEPLLAVLNGCYAPTVALLRSEPGAMPPLLEENLRGRELVEGKAAAYLCRNFACEAPVTEPAELRSRVSRMAAVPIHSF